MKKSLIAALALTGCVPLKPYYVPERVHNDATRIIANIEQQGRPCSCAKEIFMENGVVFPAFDASLSRAPGYLAITFYPNYKDKSKQTTVYDRIDDKIGVLDSKDVVDVNGKRLPFQELMQQEHSLHAQRDLPRWYATMLKRMEKR